MFLAEQHRCLISSRPCTEPNDQFIGGHVAPTCPCSVQIITAVTHNHWAAIHLILSKKQIAMEQHSIRRFLSATRFPGHGQGTGACLDCKVIRIFALDYDNTPGFMSDNLSVCLRSKLTACTDLRSGAPDRSVHLLHFSRIQSFESVRIPTFLFEDARPVCVSNNAHLIIL